MSDWQNEDDIKAELRSLTDQLRDLRQELRNMVAPPNKPNPSRAFLHRQAWPPSHPPAPAEAKERGPRRSKPKKNR